MAEAAPPKMSEAIIGRVTNLKDTMLAKVSKVWVR